MTNQRKFDFSPIPAVDPITGGFKFDDNGEIVLIEQKPQSWWNRARKRAYASDKLRESRPERRAISRAHALEKMRVPA